ncbi:MAG: hypothetical protein PHD02_04010 [Bacilli bacterium]|nr:hypothetical protein [Bacilli bacterium]
MEFISTFIISFILVYTMYYFLVVKSKKGRDKLKLGIESTFLNRVYKVKVDKIDNKKFAKTISIINSIIISLTLVATSFFFNKTIYQILLSFPIMVLLIIASYSILGRHYNKKYE